LAYLSRNQSRGCHTTRCSDIKPVELHYPGTQVLENLIFAFSRIGDPLYIFPDGKTPIIALYGASPALA
jgi:hypothetical protein